MQEFEVWRDVSTPVGEGSPVVLVRPSELRHCDSRKDGAARPGAIPFIGSGPGQDDSPRIACSKVREPIPGPGGADRMAESG